jgi:hypothetical protein
MTPEWCDDWGSTWHVLAEMIRIQQGLGTAR